MKTMRLVKPHTAILLQCIRSRRFRFESVSYTHLTGIDKKVMSNAIFGAAIDTLMKHMIDLVKDVLM